MNAPKVANLSFLSTTRKKKKSSKKNMWDSGAGAIVEDMTKDLK